MPVRDVFISALGCRDPFDRRHPAHIGLAAALLTGSVVALHFYLLYQTSPRPDLLAIGSL